jgi:hypothetical protein
MKGQLHISCYIKVLCSCAVRENMEPGAERISNQHFAEQGHPVRALVGWLV